MDPIYLSVIVSMVFEAYDALSAADRSAICTPITQKRNNIQVVICSQSMVSIGKQIEKTASDNCHFPFSINHKRAIQGTVQLSIMGITETRL